MQAGGQTKLDYSTFFNIVEQQLLRTLHLDWGQGRRKEKLSLSLLNVFLTLNSPLGLLFVLLEEASEDQYVPYMFSMDGEKAGGKKSHESILTLPPSHLPVHEPVLYSSDCWSAL